MSSDRTAYAGKAPGYEGSTAFPVCSSTSIVCLLKNQRCLAMPGKMNLIRQFWVFSPVRQLFLVD